MTGGNVGIGVTNPATLLEVSSASTNPGLAIARFTNTNGAGGGGSVIQLDRSASARVTAIEFSTANTPDWYIGQVREGGNPTTNFVFNAGNDLTLSSASKLVINNAGNVGIGTTTPQTKLAIWDGNVGIGTITADNGRLIVMGGNVGIGTTSPGAKLHVAGTSYFGDVGTAGTFRLYDATAGGTGSYVIFTNTAGKLTITPGSGSASTVNTVETTAKLVPSTDNVFVLGTTALRWLNLQVGTGDSSFAGNVGIGTTTPQGAFVVTNGNVGIGTWTAANGALSVIGGNVGIGTNTTHAMLEMTGNGAKELFRANDSGPNDISPFVIASSGNVGIGTTAPGTALDVWGTIPLRLTRSGVGDWNFLITTNAGFGGTGALRISPVNITTNTGGVEIVNTSSTAVHAFRLDGTVYHSGNVGIGTTTPQAGLVSMGNVGIGTWTSPNSLSIVGGAAIGSATSAATASPSNGLIVSGNVGIGTTSAANDNLIVNGGGNVGIGTAATSALLTVNGTIRSLSAGNVGIGSTAPGAKLDVQGGIRSSQGVAGQAACWRSDGTLGQCTSAVGVAGACTCS